MATENLQPLSIDDSIKSEDPRHFELKKAGMQMTRVGTGNSKISLEQKTYNSLLWEMEENGSSALIAGLEQDSNFINSNSLIFICYGIVVLEDPNAAEFNLDQNGRNIFFERYVLGIAHAAVQSNEAAANLLSAFQKLAAGQDNHS